MGEQMKGVCWEVTRCMEDLEMIMAVIRLNLEEHRSTCATCAAMYDRLQFCFQTVAARKSLFGGKCKSNVISSVLGSVLQAFGNKNYSCVHQYTMVVNHMFPFLQE